VQPGGDLVAADANASRPRLVASTLQRLRVDGRVLVQDARRPALAATFDAVLVDAPCSGLGSARRRPELLWRPEKDELSSLNGKFQHVVIDCPPALGLLTVNALVAASHLLIPIQSSYFALEGTDDLLETIEKVKARPNPNLELLGVLVTLHDKRTTLAREVHEQIRSVFGPKLFDTVITKSVRLEESPAYKESIFSFAPNSSGAIEYGKLCEEVISRV